MNGIACTKCGSEVLVRSYIAVRCPICGKYYFSARPAPTRPLWDEHRLGLMTKRDGWRWIEYLEPPRWFVEQVM